MPYITHVATAVPPHRTSQAEVQEFAAHLFRPHLPETVRLLPVFDNAGISDRYFSRPIEWFAAPRTFSEKNQVHLESALELGERVCSPLFAGALDPSEIDAFFVVNSTGIATPSLDAHLLHRLGMRPDVRRVPLWGLGCAGGVSGLAHACHYLQGRPRERVLLYCVELCGLTFLSRDFSRSNLIACALFGEGAAAVIVEGDECAPSGTACARVEGAASVNTRSSSEESTSVSTRARVKEPASGTAPERVVAPGIARGAGALATSVSAHARFVGALSTHYRDSLDVMGWHVVDEGLQVVFAQRIPHIVRREAARHFGTLLNRFGLRRSHLDHYLIHPGGAKVIAAYQKALELEESALDCSRSVLRDFGNMSSVTVLFVLERHLAQHGAGRAGRAVLSALGPGFSSESLLLDIPV
jgi:alkylresorcinol/alkylpyrone synthase